MIFNDVKVRQEISNFRKELSEEIELIKKDVYELRVFVNSINDRTKNSVAVLDMQKQVEERLNKFNINITDKYLETLEKNFNIAKEMFLVTTLTNVDKLTKNDFIDMQAKLMQPILEKKWEEDKKHKAKLIETSGHKILNRRNELRNQILDKEKAGENVDKLKEQLKAFDWIMEEITNEK